MEASETRPAEHNLSARLRVKRLGLSDYETVWRRMQSFTDARGEETMDELWLAVTWGKENDS